jgi:signal transduction histidine kinase
VRTSLQTRVFVATALVAIVSLGSAVHFIATRITREGEAELRRGLAEASALAERHHAARLETLTVVAGLLADLPVLKAAIDLGDPPTVQPLAEEYRAMAKADVLAVTDRHGKTLASLGTGAPPVSSVSRALAGSTVVSAAAFGGRLVEQVTVPVSINAREVLGTLSLGLALDAGFAAQLKAVTSSEVAVLFEGRTLCSTMGIADADLAAAGEDSVTLVHVAGVEYAVLACPLPAPGATSPRPVVVLARSPVERLRFLRALRTGLIGAAGVAMVLAVLLSFAVARSVAQPLASLTATMREMSASGDLSRPVPAGGRWDDEDARVLTTTFGALTSSIRRFQHEAALKDRLSALGRLSTVVAHEVRNPLMIIRASLRTLGRAELAEAERREAAADIDQEVTRLDRLVRDVLEFTKPVPVERTPTDVGAVCRDAAAALEREGLAVQVRIDPELRPLPTDGERLRRALINLLTNARDAVKERKTVGGSAAVELRASAAPSGIVLEVEDHGVGIAPDDLPHVFEPYFSTKRTGTGLGLPITRNIIESLGGTITATSRPGEGTLMKIELPAMPLPSP